MKNNRIFALVFFLVACSSDSHFEQLLTSSSGKSFWLWKRRAKDGSFIYMNNQWIFYPNGKAQCLVSSNPKIKGTPVIINMEGSNDYDWSFSSTDSVLDIGRGVKYKITEFNKDTIYMKTVDFESVLIRNE